MEARADEHRQREEAAEERCRREEAPFELDGMLALDRLPRGDREQEHRRGPERVEQGALRVAAGRVQVEEEAVGEGDQAECERRRSPRRGPAGDR